MSNEQLVEIIRAGRDRDGEYMARLWQQSENYISKIANDLAPFGEFDDLKQQGFLGICQAVDHFDSEKGVRFLTYARYWIRESMLEYIEDNSTEPASIYWQVVKLEKFVEEYERDHAERPSNAQICHFMDITEDQLESLQNAENKAVTASLDEVQSTDDGNSYTLAELTPGTDDPEADAVDAYQQEELASVIWDEVDRLDPDQAEVLHGRYESELTAREVGELTGRTGQQVADIERRALTKMRTTKRTRDALLPFWNDSEIRSAALQGNGVGSFNRSWTSSTEKTAIRMIEKEQIPQSEGFANTRLAKQYEI